MHEASDTLLQGPPSENCPSHLLFQSPAFSSRRNGVVAESLESDLFSRMSIDLPSNSNAEFCQGRGSQRAHDLISLHARPGDLQMRKLTPKRSTYRINSNIARELPPAHTLEQNPNTLPTPQTLGILGNHERTTCSCLADKFSYHCMMTDELQIFSYKVLQPSCKKHTEVNMGTES